VVQANLPFTKQGWVGLNTDLFDYWIDAHGHTGSGHGH
jgi:hypothetical protein